MLKQTYKRKLKEIKKEDPDAHFIDVTRTANAPLSSSWELEKQLNKDKIDWDTYTRKFKEEMITKSVTPILLDIAREASKKNVYLVGFKNSQFCHRFILMDMIEELAKKEKIKLEVESHHRVDEDDCDK
jgi:uncharacterized protein YeaO (DUF488 family)